MKTQNFLKSVIFLLVMAFSTVSFAGGVHCKECPAENEQCMPRLCGATDNFVVDIENGICPSHSDSECWGEK